MDKHDPVNNPKHYDLFPGQQSIDLIERCLSRKEFIGFLKGNALKYRFRAGNKDALQQDIDKANWYQNKLREYIERPKKLRDVLAVNLKRRATELEIRTEGNEIA